ncbi:MAG: SDR family NAD(P)-dependent oxidoreductase, partial [Candidatus Omnitrophota bacterium]
MKVDFLNKLFNLKGKNVLITGVLGQLGKELSRVYVATGSNVIGVDTISNYKKVDKSGNMEYMFMDITDKKFVNKGFMYIYKKYGKLDILINNAGVSVFEPFEERDEESFDRVMDVNLKGTFFCIQKYFEFLKKYDHSGNIVNIASLYGVVCPDFRIYT